VIFKKNLKYIQVNGTNKIVLVKDAPNNICIVKNVHHHLIVKRIYPLLGNGKHKKQEPSHRYFLIQEPINTLLNE
jgi:hypothetical protein